MPTLSLSHHQPSTASRSSWTHLLPHPRLLLYSMHLQYGSDPRRGFSPLALPPPPPHRRRTRPAPPRPRRPRLRQATSSSACTRQSAPPQRPPRTSFRGLICHFQTNMTHAMIMSQRREMT